jgi:hypothetical protein
MKQEVFFKDASFAGIRFSAKERGKTWQEEFLLTLTDQGH